MKHARGKPDPHFLVPDVKKIAVLSPSAVGDFIVTLPALHSLKDAYPGAHVVYIGKQWHADFLQGRPGPIDEVVVIPPVPGVGAPPDSPGNQAQVDAFLEDMRARRFDLAFQMYGGGDFSNPFVQQMGARVSIGMRAQDAPPLDRWIPYVYLQNNRLRMLDVAALAGANRWLMGQELMVTDRDRVEAAEHFPESLDQPLVVLHPGATDTRRHWPAARFAEVGDALAAQGALIAVNGVESESALVGEVIERMRYPATSLIGKLSLRGLLGLLERSALLISNDSGPLHLALAIDTPSVGIYWVTNLYVAGPLQQQRHRVALSAQTRCPVCGEENLAARCPHDVSFVTDVSVEQVRALAFELLRTEGGRVPVPAR